MIKTAPAAPPHPEALADRAADRSTYIFIAMILLASWIVISSSLYDELSQLGTVDWREPWLREFISHMALYMMLPLLPFALSKAPLSPQLWRQSVPKHLLACILFALGHILLMYAFRKILYAQLLDIEYNFQIDQFSTWLYEYRKDALSYVTIVCVFAVSRALSQQTLEAHAAKNEARSGGRLTLKSGGKTILLDASALIWAKAASNYVEIYAHGKVHLARMTLATLEALLEDANSAHVRVHRSWIVNTKAITQIRPTGQGDVRIHLSDNTIIPGSRRYRAGMEAMANVIEDEIHPNVR